MHALSHIVRLVDPQELAVSRGASCDVNVDGPNVFIPSVKSLLIGLGCLQELRKEHEKQHR
jgi:hypothetical protein